MKKNKFNQHLATNPAKQKVLEGKLQSKKLSNIQENTDNKKNLKPAKSKEEKHTQQQNNWDQQLLVIDISQCECFPFPIKKDID